MYNTYDTPTYPELGNIYPGDYYEALPYDEFIDKNQNFQKEKRFSIFAILAQDQKKIF